MRKLCLVLTITILLSMTGCSNNGSDKITDNADGNGFYYAKNRLVQVELDTVYSFTAVNNTLMLTGMAGGMYYNADAGGDIYTQLIKLFHFDMDGNQLSETVLFNSGSDPYKLPVASDIDNNGNVWILFKEYIYHEQAEVLEYHGSTLECYDSEANIISNTAMLLPDSGGMSDNMINMRPTIGENNSIYIYYDYYTENAQRINGGNVCAISPDGTVLFDIDRVKDICRLHDGRIFVSRLDITGESVSFYEVDASRNGLGVEHVIQPMDVNPEAFYTSGDDLYDILDSSRDALFGINLNNESRTMLVDWRNTAVNNSSDNLYHFAAIDGDDIICLEAVGRGRINIVKLIRADEPPDMQERVVLTIGALQDYGLSSVVEGFRQQHPEVDIQIKIYNTQDMSYRDNINAFNLDMIAGNIPDIIYITPSMHIGGLAGNGLFADLYEFIDNDPDISRNDFVPGIFTALETDGKLYTMVDSFAVKTVVGRISDVGTDMGWTWDDFNSVMEELPEGTIPISNMYGTMAREDFLQFALIAKFSDFVDYASGNCHFDSVDFVSLLEAANRYYPVDANYSIEPQDFYAGNPRFIWYTNSGALNYQSSTIFESYLGENYTFVGLPTATGTGGSCFVFDNRIAISDKSESKDAAWEFLKFILTDHQYKDDYQMDRSLNGFPVRRDALEAEAEFWYGAYYASFSERTFESSNGLLIRVPEEADIRQTLDLIYSIDSFEAYDFVIDDIIKEEVAAFFAGTRTAQETAAAIQNRAAIYMAELN